MTSENEPIIEFKDVIKVLGGRRILDHLSFSVKQGDIFFLIGYSGSGKSVTLQNLTGLMEPDSGSIRVAGQEIVGMDARELSDVRRNMGFLFQNGALINWLTVAENVDLPLREHTTMSKRHRKEIIAEKLKLVNLAEDGDKYPGEISGGMRKRASLARAIALDPDILLFDEPTSGLDPVYARQIDELTAAINRVLGITCIVVTHDMESVMSIGTRVGFFYKGRMEFCGTPDELEKSEHPKLRFFITGGKEGGDRQSRGVGRMSQVLRAQPKSMRRAQVKEDTRIARALAKGADPAKIKTITARIQKSQRTDQVAKSNSEKDTAKVNKSKGAEETSESQESNDPQNSTDKAPEKVRGKSL